MKKTLISHFYNEEYLLPWFLNHHRQVFDHGIMIDYASTDHSREIIQELCPGWDIVPSRNDWFDPGPVDQEVIDIENSIDGWRICLNVTEHLIGNYSILDDQPAQHLIPAFVFVDTDPNQSLDHNKPLYEQKRQGFAYFDQNFACFQQRQARSLHNHPVQYQGMGRHFTNFSTEELAIFYYGWCPLNETAMARKLSMGSKVPDWVSAGRHHTFPRSWIEDRYTNLFLPWTRDLSSDIDYLIENHKLTLNAA